ncbi:MAG: hypothetical protein AMXMBFR77_28800 [Phycisphaerales bacterium]
MAEVDDKAKKVVEAFETGKLDLGPELTKAALEDAMARRAGAVKAGLAARAAQLSASNDLKAANKDISSLVTRIRSTTRGKYGADSTKWELVGGVRTSERKKKTQKPKG